MAGLKRAALGAEGTAYEADISAWAEEQARHLRSGRWSQLDILNLADEIEAVSRTERHALTSALHLILLHMLKWDYQPGRRSRSWTVTIRTQRLAVAEQIEDSPSLRAQLGRLMDRAYDRARIEAASETMLDEATFPPACPYDLADVMERPFPLAFGAERVLIDPMTENRGRRPALEAGHGARLTVDLGAVAENWRRLSARGAGKPCGAVIKADAYGCGLAPVARALWAAGCRTFFVAHLEEGIAARASLPGATIYVLNGLLPSSAPAYPAHALRPVLGSREELQEWAEASRGTLPAALHVDTGMNRLGLSVPEGLALAGDPLVAQAGIGLLMSHLVSAEKPDDPVNARQIADFARLRAAFSGLEASLANSSGIYLGAQAHHDLLRPGYALFGGNPVPTAENPMRPVVRLEAPILQVREVRAGESAGYNGLWTAAGPRRLATLSLGYADGYPRSASTSGRALVGGVACPMLGLVSMDLVILDVTNAPDARRGATAVLIGDRLDIDAVGRAAGTIGYEVLTSLGSRYVRDYVG